jgi:hypothetical protein
MRVICDAAVVPAKRLSHKVTNVHEPGTARTNFNFEVGQPRTLGSPGVNWH